MYTVITGSAPVLGWRPAPTGAPGFNPATARRLGQAGNQVPAVSPGMVVPSPRPAFIDSRPVQVITDVAALVPSAMLAFAFSKHKSKWGYVFWASTVFFGLKLIVDVTSLER